MAGAALGWYGKEAWERVGPRFTGHTEEVRKPAFGMPGPFPGRVIEVHDPASIDESCRINAREVQRMMSRGMVD